MIEKPRKECPRCKRGITNMKRTYCSKWCVKLERIKVLEDRKVFLQAVTNELVMGTPSSEKIISKDLVLLDENGYRITCG